MAVLIIRRQSKTTRLSAAMQIQHNPHTVFALTAAHTFDRCFFQIQFCQRRLHLATIYIDNNTGINPVGSPARLTASEFTPNPARSFSRLTVGCPENGVAHIQLLDLLGNTVRDDYQQLDRGWNTVTVAADDLRPGIYLAKVYFGKEVVIRRMIVAAH